jgi:type II secretory pathway pseudopilin PulG
MLIARAANGSPGYAMAAFLVSLAIMSIMMSLALPAWRHAVQREKEEELVFRGQQYARAVGLFQRRYANAFPPTIDLLVEQKFLRKKYKDPVTGEDFEVLYQASMQGPGRGQMPGGQPGRASPRPSGSAAAPAIGSGSGQTGLGQTQQPIGPRGGIVGVSSKSKDASIRVYNGATRYNEWLFVYTAATMQPGGMPGAQQPGAPGQGRPGQEMRGGPGGRGQPGGQQPGAIPPGGIRPPGGAMPPGGRPPQRQPE